MKINIKLHAQYLFRTAGMLTCILQLLFVTIACTDKEPAFTVKGDKAITKEIKVNVEVIKENGTTLTTVFYNGESFKIDNQQALRYKIYVSYKDSFFYSTEADNLHGKIKGKTLNEIVIEKKDGSVTALYRPLEESGTVGARNLEPSDIFFDNINQATKEKEKFTGFYKIK